MWPLAKCELRDDAYSPRSIVFRLISFTFMSYCAWAFMQDEQNLQDLKEFTSKGVSDLLDYSKDWEYGTKQVGNGTESSSFKDKYK